jgi:hypothetical protein
LPSYDENVKFHNHDQTIMKAIGLNNLRGAAFTKSSRTDERTNGQKEKLYDL